jgi:hypothetical protein
MEVALLCSFIVTTRTFQVKIDVKINQLEGEKGEKSSFEEEKYCFLYRRLTATKIELEMSLTLNSFSKK